MTVVANVARWRLARRFRPSSQLSPSPIAQPSAQATSRHPLVLALMAASAGIVIGRHFGQSPFVWWGGALLLVGAWHFSRRWQRPVIGQVFLLAAVTLFFAGRYNQAISHFLPNDIGYLATDDAQPVVVQGQVSSSLTPVYAEALSDDEASGRFQSGDQTRFNFRANYLRDGSVWRSVTGNCRVIVDGHLLGVRAGDTVQLSCQLRKPSDAMNPGQFSLADYEASQGFLSRLTVKHPQAVVVIDQSSSWNIRWWIARLRGSLGNSLWERIGPENYGLASAILLGPRENLSDTSVQAFFLTGTIHILAISGLHVGIIASGFLYAARLQWVPQRWAWYGVIVITVLYTLLAESRAPVVRATALIVILCLGNLWRQVSAAWNTLSAAALVVLIWQPGELYQVGALLSFLAVGALASFVPNGLGKYPEDPLERLILNVKPRWQLRVRSVFWKSMKMALASLAVWCAVLPLVVHHFHIVTPVGLALNIILFVPVGIALFSGMGTLAFSWLVPPFADLCGWLCGVSLSFMEWSVRECQSLPGGHMWWAGPSEWVVWAYYLGLACLLPWASMAGRWIGLSLLTFLYVVMAVSGLGRETANQPRFRCTFMSVGHGLSVVMELPDHQLWLYDAGALGDPRFTCDTIARFLWANGHHDIDELLISHSDADHYNAVPGLMQRFAVDRISITSQMAQTRDAPVASLLRMANDHHVEVKVIEEGVTLLDTKEIQIRVVHPDRQAQYSSDNASSAVVEVRAFGRTVLLTGDLEMDGMIALRQRYTCQADVALIPHHGSPHGDPLDFAAWCHARWLVVSGNQSTASLVDQSQFHNEGVRLLHTARNGAITVTIDQQGLRVETWR